MTESNLISNVQSGKIEVYAFNPKDRFVYEKNIKDLPSNWLLYPNPLVPEGTLEQADLQNPEIEKFLFEEIIPHTGFILGEKPPTFRK